MSTAINLRSISIAFVVLSLVAPLSWFGYQQWLFSQWLKEAEGPVCGMPFFGAVVLSSIAMFSISSIGLFLAGYSYKSLPMPRPRKRFYEILFLSIPFVASSILLALVFYA